MKIVNLLVMLFLIAATPAIAIASGETIALGPATISLDLENIGSYTIEKESVISMDHEEKDIRFQYEITPANIIIDDKLGQIILEVHQMSTAEPMDVPISERDQSTGIEHCIQKSDMIHGSREMTMKEYEVDGHDGVLATIEIDSDDPLSALGLIESNDPLYVLGWCLDQKDGEGSVVCVIGSDLPWETTKDIFDSISSDLA